MAEAVLTFFLQKLSILVTEEATLLLGVDEEVRLLQNELEWISLFIKGTDIKRRSDPKVKLWVKQLREVTFHAEDVIDQFMLKVDQQRRHDGGFMMGCINCIDTLPLLHELGNKIKVVTIMAEKISANQSKYCIEDLQFNDDHSRNQHASLLTERKTIKRALTLIESNMCGVEDGFEQVKSLLMREGDDRKQLIAVSIVGMGGLGKTTLARKIHQSNDSKRYFDCVSWVSISQEYRMSEVIISIIICLTQKYSNEDLEKLDEHVLSNKMRELLQGRKYLIVLDDVWDTKVWETLGIIFPGEMNGSRILITTRNKEIAMHAGNSCSVNIYELRFLSACESWELFLRKTFSVGLAGNSTLTSSRCPLELQDVGKAMVEKCHGLPLAIVVLGGLLSSKNKTPSTWSKVYSRLTWELTHDCEISASTLCQYWIAEGFIQSRGGEIMEDVAEDYLEELIHRSLIQVGKMSLDGKVKTCRVHDLLRDMCIAEAKEDHFSQVCTSADDFPKSNNVRRLVIHGSNDTDRINELDRYTSKFRYSPCVRSLIFFGLFAGVRSGKPFWRSLCGGFKLLKVLDLQSSSSGYLIVPPQLGELTHLRYLKLKNFKLIQTSFANKLINLQTLHLCDTDSGSNLFHIWGLHQLRHLHVSYIAPPSLWNRMVSNNRHLWIRNLENLHTLDVYVGGWLMHCGGWETLGMLRKVKLSGYFPYKKEVLVSIMRLTKLQSLHLYTIGEFPAFDQFSRHGGLRKLIMGGKLPTRFLFPPKLVKLTLNNSAWFSKQLTNAIGKLDNLKSLKLMWQSHFGKSIIFVQGKFLQLQILELICLDNLEEVVVQDGALLLLTHLKITKCEKMQMLPEGLRQLTMVQELKVNGMPREFNARLAENVGEDWDKIKHIPSVNVYS